MLSKEICKNCKKKDEETPNDYSTNIFMREISFDCTWDSKAWKFYCRWADDYLDKNSDIPEKCHYVLEQTVAVKKEGS